MKHKKLKEVLKRIWEDNNIHIFWNLSEILKLLPDVRELYIVDIANLTFFR